MTRFKIDAAKCNHNQPGLPTTHCTSIYHTELFTKTTKPTDFLPHCHVLTNLLVHKCYNKLSKLTRPTALSIIFKKVQEWYYNAVTICYQARQAYALPFTQSCTYDKVQDLVHWAIAIAIAICKQSQPTYLSITYLIHLHYYKIHFKHCQERTLQPTLPILLFSRFIHHQQHDQLMFLIFPSSSPASPCITYKLARVDPVASTAATRPTLMWGVIEWLTSYCMVDYPGSQLAMSTPTGTARTIQYGTLPTILICTIHCIMYTILLYQNHIIIL